MSNFGRKLEAEEEEVSGQGGWEGGTIFKKRNYLVDGCRGGNLEGVARVYVRSSRRYIRELHIRYSTFICSPRIYVRELNILSHRPIIVRAEVVESSLVVGA